MNRCGLRICCQNSSSSATPWRAIQVAEHAAVRTDGDGAARMGGHDPRQRRVEPDDAGAAAPAAFELEVEIGVHLPGRRLDIGHVRHPTAEGPLAQVLVDTNLEAGVLGKRSQRVDRPLGAGGQRIDAELRQHRREVCSLPAAFLREPPFALRQRRIGGALGVPDQDQGRHKPVNPFNR
jgi:hypothetical protein